MRERRSGRERRRVREGIENERIENEVRTRIVQDVEARITGHYSGYLSNGDKYEVDLTLTNFEMTNMDLELTIIR